MGLCHFALAVEGCSWTNPDYFALMVANTVSDLMINCGSSTYLLLWMVGKIFIPVSRPILKCVGQFA